MLSDPLTDPHAPVTVADLAANGATTPPAPRWRIRPPQYKRVELTGQWAGAWLDMLLNPGMALLADISAGKDGSRWHMHRLIRAWNFEDADGNALEVSVESVGLLDDDTVIAIFEAWHKARDVSKSR